MAPCIASSTPGLPHVILKPRLSPFFECLPPTHGTEATDRLYSLASQPYFSAYAHARAKVGGGREGKIRLGARHTYVSEARAN